MAGRGKRNEESIRDFLGQEVMRRKEALTRPEGQGISRIVLLCACLVVSLSTFLVVNYGFSSPDEQYVYYAYLPPSVVNYSSPVRRFGLATPELIGTLYNYTKVPSYLDLVATQDDTNYELYDLRTKGLLRSGSLNWLDHLRIAFGSRAMSAQPLEGEDFYIKIVTNKPVSALVWGGVFRQGPDWSGPQYVHNVTTNFISSFIPGVDGGFIGKEFAFLAFPTFGQPKMYVEEIGKYDIFATEDSKVTINDASGNLVEQLDVVKLSMKRTTALEPWKAYTVTSTGNIMVYGTAANSMVYVPALTGGFVGRMFLATKSGNLQTGDLQSYIIVALEDAKVEFYDMRKPAGSAADRVLNLKKTDMVFDTFLQTNWPTMIKSTGNITLLCGGNTLGWGTTWSKDPGYVVPQNIAVGIAFLGARTGQEIGFYAPYKAAIFATDGTDVEVNGIPRTLRKDDFIMLTSGSYLIKPTSAPVIVEVLGDTSVIMLEATRSKTSTEQEAITAYISKGFDHWGSYLISAQTLYKSYAAVQEGDGMDLFLYVGIGAGAAVAVIGVAMVMRRRKKA